MSGWFLRGALVAFLVLATEPAVAAWRPAPLLASAPARPRGRPKVVLDELTFPADVVGAPSFKKHLRLALAREARRADWGAGRSSRIEFRFKVTELSITPKDDVLLVSCTAVGKLPKGKSAKSHLAYSGEPSKRNDLVRRVLDIVARGVITRLAELERVRRGDLHQSWVRAPRSEPVD
jgi:hypothetical protein